MSNWKPSEDAVELLEQLRESVSYWENRLEETERFRGGDLEIDIQVRDIKDKLIQIKFMQYMVRRNAFP